MSFRITSGLEVMVGVDHRTNVFNMSVSGLFEKMQFLTILHVIADSLISAHELHISSLSFSRI